MSTSLDSHVPPSVAPARRQFLSLVDAALEQRALIKLTLGKHRGADSTLRNVFLRPVELKVGPRVAVLWRYATRDETKNLPRPEAQALVDSLLGTVFLDAHLFTREQSAQLECAPGGGARLRISRPSQAAPAEPLPHDRRKAHVIPTTSAWLRTLGVTNERGQPREGMADKFRQIQKFSELLTHLLDEAFGPAPARTPEAAAAAPAQSRSSSAAPLLHVVDMGAGKGYLTFALAEVLGGRAQVQGVEARTELVELCNRAARQHGLQDSLRFTAGTIANTEVRELDVLLALHACDTATDDALAKGIHAKAKLLVVAPCCQKELRRQLQAPPVLAPALRHGIFQERQAEFATDALRALLLEWAGYRTKVFEFISSEHTAKNLMIAAVFTNVPGDEQRAQQARAFAQFYGIRSQRLAEHLSFSLTVS